MESVMNVLREIWVLVNEMSPYLLLGFLLAGLMHEYIPADLFKRYLNGRNFRSVVLAALFGVPLPLCSCGVIPTAMGLRRQGASKGATVSFLIATPQTGVDSIIATYSLMGLPFAIIRPLVALVTAVFGGWLVNAADKDDTPAEIPEEATKCHCHHEGEEEEEEEHCCCHQHEETEEEHCHCHHDSPKHRSRLLNAINYAFMEMMEDIGKWLVIGLVIAGLITALVPDSWFTAFKGNSLLSILFVLLFSIPMYLCATGSIPIAVALMLKGLTPGAALVLLMAGPAANAASVMVIGKALGRKSLIVYLASIIAGAVLFGLGIDYLLPSEWFTGALAVSAECCESGPGWFSICCTILLAILLVNALVRSQLDRFGKKERHGCNC